MMTSSSLVTGYCDINNDDKEEDEIHTTNLVLDAVKGEHTFHIHSANQQKRNAAAVQTKDAGHGCMDQSTELINPFIQQTPGCVCCTDGCCW